MAIGMCPKDRLFKGYIEVEQKLHEFVRCRTLYEKHIEYNPSNAQAWIKFAELERALDDLDRARAIFELAVTQMDLDMPELVWKSYIDFEEEEGEWDNTRMLYERLLEKTEHVKVWISYAHFEINVPDDDQEEESEEVSEEAKERARRIFEKAYKRLKERDLKEEVCVFHEIPLTSPLVFLKNMIDLLLTAFLFLSSNSESSCLMLGSLLNKHTVMRHRSNVLKIKCPEKSRREERWMTIVMRNTWTIYSLQMKNKMLVYSSCCKLLTNGNKPRQHRARSLERKRVLTRLCLGNWFSFPFPLSILKTFFMISN